MYIEVPTAPKSSFLHLESPHSHMHEPSKHPDHHVTTSGPSRRTCTDHARAPRSSLPHIIDSHTRTFAGLSHAPRSASCHICDSATLVDVYKFLPALQIIMPTSGLTHSLTCTAVLAPLFHPNRHSYILVDSTFACKQIIRAPRSTSIPHLDSTLATFYEVISRTQFIIAHVFVITTLLHLSQVILCNQIIILYTWTPHWHKL